MCEECDRLLGELRIQNNSYEVLVERLRDVRRQRDDAIKLGETQNQLIAALQSQVQELLMGVRYYSNGHSGSDFAKQVLDKYYQKFS